MCLGIPGEIVAIEEPSEPGALLQGLVSFGGVRKRVCLAYVPEAKVGDYAIVHAGFALNLIDPEQAGEIFATLAEAEAAWAAEGPKEDHPERARAGPRRAMKYLDEYRAAGPARTLLEQIRRTVTRPWTLMEVCGGQTHNLMKFGIDRALPEQVELVHGPGCPVCVTPLETLDRAMTIAGRPDVIFATFGDMLRVPGSHENLFGVRSRGGDVRIVYSPLDALELARAHPREAGRFPRRRLRDDRAHRRRRRARGRIGWAWTTSRCWSRTSACRRPWRRSSARPATGFRPSSPRGTCAR